MMMRYGGVHQASLCALVEYILALCRHEQSYAYIKLLTEKRDWCPNKSIPLGRLMWCSTADKSNPANFDVYRTSTATITGNRPRRVHGFDEGLLV